MAALDAEHYLQEIGAQEGKDDWPSPVIHLYGSIKDDGKSQYVEILQGMSKTLKLPLSLVLPLLKGWRW